MTDRMIESDHRVETAGRPAEVEADLRHRQDELEYHLAEAPAANGKPPDRRAIFQAGLPLRWSTPGDRG
jgi:hypothetical protein